MIVPMIDLHAQYQDIKKEIDAAITQILEETSFIGGPEVRQFEEDFKTVVGAGHVISCANGTDSMEMTLKALNISAGDEVIVPAHTWISTSEVVVTAGAVPVFADVAFDSCCISIEDIKKKITTKTKAIIAVHLYGHPADLDALVQLSEEHNLHLIEDCAQAHGSTYKGQPVGSFGTASSFSFYPGKNLGCYGDGGAVFTKDEQLALKIRQLGNHGQLTKHDHRIHGRNSRLDTLQARVLSVKIPYLKGWIEKKNEHAAYYHEGLKGIKEIDLPTLMGENRYHSWHLYVLKTKKRDALKAYLQEQDIQCGIHYPKALPFQPCYSDFDHKKTDFPVAARLQDEVLSLPMYAELEKEQLDHVISSITTFFER
ncbi:DegT/DnrJ/EryC1/StrS family aminotransferase [Flavimarina sp. Hel_I_48]|uniref:DegT/DnrJ/EryC1/StrS family aminotransferase n=1 Tax=Flavimarina sp. Hel_I_48 TaxID=1392488 RepID=UPI0004DF7653|nr:DegT/DnrJ/EryC1/StrS family aminotransferase [Flavimarina sp. Hel_I_48]